MFFHRKTQSQIAVSIVTIHPRDNRVQITMIHTKYCHNKRQAFHKQASSQYHKNTLDSVKDRGPVERQIRLVAMPLRSYAFPYAPRSTSNRSIFFLVCVIGGDRWQFSRMLRRERAGRRKSRYLNPIRGRCPVDPYARMFAMFCRSDTFLYAPRPNSKLSILLFACIVRWQR